MKYVTSIVMTLIIAGVIALIGTEYTSIQKNRARSEAVDGCMNIARYTFTNSTGTTALEIVDNYFTKCMEAKNLK